MSALLTAKTCLSQSEVQIMDRNINPDDMYETVGFIGEGDFGQVTKCLNKQTGKIVAVKSLKNTEYMEQEIQRELAMLNAIRTLDPDANNIVKFFQYFKSTDGLHFMEFEMLDISVWDLMIKRGIPFSLNEIRPMAKQLLVALEGLRRVGIMHMNIKPDNIMLVDHQNQPFKLKLIDFGLSRHKYETTIGMLMQPLSYRAPEVTLGLPLSEAVDMWSLGCCLMQWYLWLSPFKRLSSYDHLQKIFHLMGVPDDELLQQAGFLYKYFIQGESGWRFKTPFEYEYTQGVYPEMLQNGLEAAQDLEHVIKYFYVMESGLEFEDRGAFFDLLKKMFHLNPEKRITPTEALRHPFITREHLTSNSYLELSKRLLTYTPTQAAPICQHSPSTDLRIASNERSPGQISMPPSRVTPENSSKYTSFSSPDWNSSSSGSLTYHTASIGGISERATSCSSPTNTKFLEECSGTKHSADILDRKSRSLKSKTSASINGTPEGTNVGSTSCFSRQYSFQGQIPEISSSKSTKPPSATSEKVNEDSARPDSKPENQCTIGPKTVQNDERPLPPSVENEAASQHPNQDTNNEEQTDTGNSIPDDSYETLGFIGEGDFSKVTKCLNKQTGEIVAVKSLKNTEYMEHAIQRELAMLNAIRTLDPDANNIVKFFQYFKSTDGLHFLEFEMLDLSVWDLMNKRGIPFSLNEIRPMAKHLLFALEGLRRVGIMHMNIKPDNIMLVDHQNQPFKLKLIDFGLSRHKYETTIGMTVQPLAYRAPEVTLGLPLSEAVDMWSLGCCLMQWYLWLYPFDGLSNYDHLQKIFHLMGVPDDELLQQAGFLYKYFIQGESGWRFKTPFEYEYTQGVYPEMLQNGLEAAQDLEHVIKYFYVMESGLEFEDRGAFFDLLKKMFHLNPEKRITPTEALRHPFITREHLTSNSYLELSKRLLTYTPTQAAPICQHSPSTDLRIASNERSPGQISTPPL